MEDPKKTKTRNRLRTPARWTLSIVLVLAFAGAGLPKLVGFDSPGGSAADFERWGYPPWFRTLVGAGETLAALLLVLPRPVVLGAPPTFWAALGLVVDMVGALATHLAHGEMAMVGFPATLLALCCVLAALTRPGRADVRLVRGAPSGGGAP